MILQGKIKKAGFKPAPTLRSLRQFGSKLRAFALLQLFDQLRDDFEEVADDAEVGVNADYGFSATTLPSFQM